MQKTVWVLYRDEEVIKSCTSIDKAINKALKLSLDNCEHADDENTCSNCLFLGIKYKFNGEKLVAVKVGNYSIREVISRVV